jgi:hypothetical protein
LIADPEAVRLGIVPPEQRLPVKKCLFQGWLRVNLPVTFLIFAGYGIMALAFSTHAKTPKALHAPTATDPGVILGLTLFIPIFLLVVVGPVLPAWLWWSLAIPKWRIWALRHVDNWPELEAAAVEDKLTWPRGSVFSKTEIKSRPLRQLEVELTRYRDLHQDDCTTEHS